MTTSKGLLASISLLFSSCIYTMDIIEHQPSRTQKKALTALMIKGCLQAPEMIKKRNPLLLHHDGEFSLMQDGKLSKIPYENIKGFKDAFTPEQFKGFLDKGGYFWVDSNEQGDVFLEAKMRALGGGPALGTGAMWGVRLLGYGTILGMIVTGHVEVITEFHLLSQTIEHAANTAFWIGLAIPGA